MKELKLAKDLITFIDKSPVSYFAVKNIANELENNGYKALNEGDEWKIVENGKYYVERNLSSLIAFHVGSKLPKQSGYKIVGAHTDSPLLKIKPESLVNDNGYLKLNIEVYGGGIDSTWLDRDLSIAGKIIIKSDNKITNQLIDFKRPIGIIPNLAIHLNRDVNKGFEYNKQNHLSFIFQSNVETTKKIDFKDIISNEFKIDKNNIIEMDLFLYDTNKGSIVGLNNDIVTIGKLDNLSMCHSILQSLTASKNSDSTKIGAFFDNEEIGSRTMMGADSNFLESVLNRINKSLGGDFEDSLRARFKSFMISADGAHATHPNFKEKHDPSYFISINKGPVIKYNANYRYATTSNSAAYFINICNKLNIPFQKLNNKSDVPCGSTIGPMTSSKLGIETVDIGNPMFAMHSIRESQGVLDHYYIIEILKEFYSS